MNKLVLLFLVLAGSAWPQGNEPSLLKNATIELLVNDVIIADGELNRIIDEFGLRIGKTDINNTLRKGEYILFADPALLSEVIERTERLGSTELKKIETLNHAATIKQFRFDLAYLTEQKKLFRHDLEINDPTGSVYKELFNRERELDKQIYEKNRELMILEEEIDRSTITLDFHEKSAQDLESRDGFTDFINMPGFETKFFNLENPGSQGMSDRYLGGSLRYMFTKGRSYFLIGILKPLDGTGGGQDLINDIVIYGIGKDFYPRYFGQGRNTFLNPFSGFEAGGMVLTSDSGIDHIFTVEPHIGVELFKNKYVIIDARIGYLFPLDEEKVKSHRGFTQNLSINIVF